VVWDDKLWMDSLCHMRSWSGAPDAVSRARASQVISLDAVSRAPSRLFALHPASRHVYAHTLYTTSAPCAYHMRIRACTLRIAALHPHHVLRCTLCVGSLRWRGSGSGWNNTDWDFSLKCAGHTCWLFLWLAFLNLFGLVYLINGSMVYTMAVLILYEFRCWCFDVLGSDTIITSFYTHTQIGICFFSTCFIYSILNVLNWSSRNGWWFVFRCFITSNSLSNYSKIIYKKNIHCWLHIT
jgi:hypothetical protein